MRTIGTLQVSRKQKMEFYRIPKHPKLIRDTYAIKDRVGLWWVTNSGGGMTTIMRRWEDKGRVDWFQLPWIENVEQHAKRSRPVDVVKELLSKYYWMFTDPFSWRYDKGAEGKYKFVEISLNLLGGHDDRPNQS